jgi:hypothetical protein
MGLLNLNTKAEYLRQKGEGVDPVRVTVNRVTPMGLLNLNTKAEYTRQKGEGGHPVRITVLFTGSHPWDF